MNDRSTIKKKVAIYTRVSTIEQAEEGYSIDEQSRVLRDYCAEHDYEIFQEYTDRGISGKNIKGRPSLMRLLDDTKDKQFDLVLVWKMNRLSRKLSDLTKIEELLKNNNIAFRSYTERYETETPAGKLQFHMMAAISEFERDNIAENVKMGMLARAKEGSWNGGQVLGYDVVSTDKKEGKRKLSSLVINDHEACIVRKIYDLYTSGNGYKSIANQLNKEGYSTKKNKLFSIGSIQGIVSNPIYAGYIRYNVRRDWNEKRRNNINPDPVIVRGKHTPIITEQVWEKAKAIKASRGGKPNRIHSGEWPLTGVMKCPMCGAGMVLSRTTNRLKDGTKRVIEYYSCGRWKNKGTAACRSNNVRCEYADAYVIDKIAEIATNETLIEEILNNIYHKNSDNSKPTEQAYEEVKQLLDAVEIKKNKVLELYEDGLIKKEDFTNRFNSLNEQKEQFKQRIKPLIERKSEEEKVKVINHKTVREVMQNFSKAFATSLTGEQKKSLVRLLIKEITISENRKIDTIKIQLNKEVINHFTIQKGAKSSMSDDFAPSFSIIIDINRAGSDKVKKIASFKVVT